MIHSFPVVLSQGTEEDPNAYGSAGSYETREVQAEYFIDLER